MSGSWSKIVVPEIKNLEEIMFEEVKDNFKRKQKNKDCILTLSTIKWRQDIGDEQLAKILQGDTSRCESDQHDSEITDFEDIKSNDQTNKQKNNLSKKPKNEEYLSTLSTIKWKCDIGDEQLAKILQEHQYSKENHILKCRKNQDSLNNDDSDIEDMENIDDKIYWERFDSVLKKYDPIPLHNGKSKYNTITNTKYKNNHGSDAKTTLILDKMIMNGIFDRISGVMATGKEATIFNARKEIVSPDIVTFKNYVVKVYKNKQLITYWIYDYKTDKYKHTKKYSRSKQLAPLKAKKEMLYYERMKNAGIPCPEVIALEEHVIVLSVIGENNPVPSLLCAQIETVEKRIKAYKQVVQYMKTLYVECNLIHGDLSSENILWYNDTCYLIDLGQSVEPHKEQAFHFLFNDCRNICDYFSMLYVPKVLSAEDLFLEITGYNYLNRFSLAELQEITTIKYKDRQENAIVL